MYSEDKPGCFIALKDNSLPQMGGISRSTAGKMTVASVKTQTTFVENRSGLSIHRGVITT